MAGCVSPIAGTSSCDSVSDITAGTVTNAAKVSRCVLVTSTSCSSWVSLVRFGAFLPVTEVTFLDNHDTQREEAQLTCKMVTSISLQTPHSRLTWQSCWQVLPTWRLESSTIRLQLCLPASHTNTCRPISGKGNGGLCLSRHRAQCAGAETELLLTISAHFDLISWVVGVKTKGYVSCLSVTWRVLVLYAVCSSHIRQGGHRIASPLTSGFSVRIMGELAELLQPSILVLVSTIYAVMSKSLGGVMKFMLELVALLWRIICVCGD